MSKESVHKDEIIILGMYETNVKTVKYIKQKLTILWEDNAMVTGVLRTVRGSEIVLFAS